MLAPNEFLKNQIKFHSDSIRELKLKAISSNTYINPSLKYWREYKAHKRQCSIALSALKLSKMLWNNAPLTNDIADEVKLFYNITLGEARRYLKHIDVVLKRKNKVTV